MVVGVAAALVHQGCSVHVFDLDMVASRAALNGTRGSINLKASELHPYYLSTGDLYCFCLVDVFGVVVIVEVIWRGENTLINNQVKFIFIFQISIKT